MSKGGRAARPLSIVGIRTDLLLSAGRWHVDQVRAAAGISCKGVTIVKRVLG